MKTAWEEEKATWEQADDLTPWQQPGVAGTADRLAEPASSNWVGLDRAWHTFDVTDLVEQWAARPADNEGALIRGSAVGSSVGYSFASSEYPEECQRPVLFIIYTVNGQLTQG